MFVRPNKNGSMGWPFREQARSQCITCKHTICERLRLIGEWPCSGRQYDEGGGPSTILMGRRGLDRPLPPPLPTNRHAGPHRAVRDITVMRVTPLPSLSNHDTSNIRFRSSRLLRHKLYELAATFRATFYTTHHQSHHPLPCSATANIHIRIVDIAHEAMTSMLKPPFNSVP
ncbi:hypothetical protein PMI35_04447 [Pseudomonas sp. GM78]|nr:hypothetical protein PMI35_04447 [Pseudomonas sp. GM78]